MSEQPIRVVNSVAPIRICDNGGWTDTWFARYGSIFNIAVYPYAEVQMRVFRGGGPKTRITIKAENYGHTYTIEKPRGDYSKHPLLEAAIEYMDVPDGLLLELSIFSEAPVGASTGTSAAVSVAMIGALDALRPGRMTPHEVARTAQKIETEMLKQQCGIQDQLASAYGGINFIEMHEYPHAVVSPIMVPNSVWWELERRLVLVSLGQSHNSSEVHRMVIAELEGEGPEAPRLGPLRTTAGRARDALYSGDFAALGRSMSDNTEYQRGLHPKLVGEKHQRIIDIARAHGAVGWKVNGAGGDGGSVAVLCDDDASRKRAMVAAIEQDNPAFMTLPIYLSRFGLRVWEAG